MTPAVLAAGRAGVPIALHEYEPDPHAPSYGMEAAEKIGVDPRRVFKTLVAKLDGSRLVVALVPVDRSLDLKALAGATGAKKAAIAEPHEAERATGYVVGGISPLGQRKRLPAVIDASALEHDRICVSAGRRGLQIEIDPRDLVQLLRAGSSRISR